MSAISSTIGRLSSRGMITSKANRKLLGSNINWSTNQANFICHKDHIDPEVLAVKSKPWPYETKKWTFWHMRFGIDPTTHHFDENSVVITIDGNIASGKGEFGQKLADKLGMKFIPEPKMHDMYVNAYGFDYRTLNKFLPKAVEFLDFKRIFEDPGHIQAGPHQCEMYRLRYYHYVEALAHLFNTGQGVILERSPHTDLVFLRSMFRMGHVHKSVAEHYLHLLYQTLFHLNRPHLMIYLDISAEEALKRIKEREDPVLANSPLMQDTAFLEHIERGYKEQLLPKMSEHAELLCYDWIKGGDVDMVVEDIEQLNFDQYALHGEKIKDWRMVTEIEWDRQRIRYTHEMHRLLTNFIIPNYDVEGMLPPHDVCAIFNKVCDLYTTRRYYAKGYDPVDVGYWKALTARDGGKNYRAVQKSEWFPFADSNIETVMQ